MFTLHLQELLKYGNPSYFYTNQWLECFLLSLLFVGVFVWSGHFKQGGRVRGVEDHPI